VKHSISAVLPAYLRDSKEEALKADLQTVQNYLDETDLKLDTPTLYFVPLRGIYAHIDRKMAITGIIINRHEKPVSELALTIRLKTDVTDMEIAIVKLALPPDFVGNLLTNQALLISLSVPVRGLTEDKTFEAFQFQSELDNVKIIEASEAEG